MGFAWSEKIDISQKRSEANDTDRKVDKKPEKTSTLPIRGFSDYFMENTSIKAANQMQITSICNADCIFCSNKQNPFRIKRLGFRPVEEIEKIVWSTNTINGQIALNESLPGRISEGEALLHPDLFKILKIIRDKFRNPISITTNGALLTKDMIKNLADFRPIKLRISITSTRKDYWTRSFRLSPEQFQTALDSVELASSAGLNVLPTIIPMPSWVGYEDIEETVKFIQNAGLKEILVYAPGYTKYTDSSVVDLLKYDKNEMSCFLDEMGMKYGMRLKWSLDPNKELQVNPRSLESILDAICNKDSDRKKVYWFTSISAYDRLSELVDRVSKNFPIVSKVVPVENHSYGGNIECTGLWFVGDIRRKIKELNISGETVVLPTNFVDAYGYDLAGENILDYAKESGNKLWLERA